LSRALVFFLASILFIGGCSRLQEAEIQKPKEIKTVMIGSAKLKIIDESAYPNAPDNERMHYPYEAIPTKTVQEAGTKEAATVDESTQRPRSR
jgi:hypothetical protein